MWMGWGRAEGSKKMKEKNHAKKSQKETTWTTRISSITLTEETSIDNNGQ
jgi:hypothetical protein